MKLIIDESTGKRVASALAQNHDVLFVGDIERGLDDASILERAYIEQRVLITNDKDFGELVYHKRSPHQGVILLRLRIDSHSMRIKVIEQLISKLDASLESHFIVASESNFRVRE